MNLQRQAIAESLTPMSSMDPTAHADLAAPIVPAVPSEFAAPAFPAPLIVPDIPRVFGNGMAAFKEQDDTKYKTLGRMNVVCSRCSALHWIEVMISVTINNYSISFVILILIILILIQFFFLKT